MPVAGCGAAWKAASLLVIEMLALNVTFLTVVIH
jgi:hypothetical protein